MQKILFFNTISSYLNIILENNMIIISKKIESKKQSEIVISSLNNVLLDNNLDYNDLNYFSTIIGPGNFTSIKSNLAIVKALKISTNKTIITNDFFEILSFNEKNYDLILLDLENIKYYIKKNNDYTTIFKKDLENFLQENKNSTILTNDINIKGENIKYSSITDEKTLELINYKIKNNIFDEELKPLYIEEASVSVRK